MKLNIKTPSTSIEWEEYYLFRWKILREPIGLDNQSTKDNLEESSYHLMVTDNNKIIGVGRIHFLNSKEAQIRYMAVDNKYQKKGIGRKIVYGLEEFSKENGRSKIILNARDNAAKFYSNLGYENLGPIDVGIAIKHFKMAKNLKIILPRSNNT